ncbi:hypothetical protein JB92DRAFT_2985092 [Gautieria morchelliformis]|nr:hypothetical protein JB92DRAFT_2985092 [Gautieria morchelliformis]
MHRQAVLCKLFWVLCPMSTVGHETGYPSPPHFPILGWEIGIEGYPGPWSPGTIYQVPEHVVCTPRAQPGATRVLHAQLVLASPTATQFLAHAELRDRMIIYHIIRQKLSAMILSS